MPEFVNIHSDEGAKFFSATTEQQLKLTNVSNTTLYYDNASTVSASSNDGNLTQNQSATFTEGQWVIPSANTQVLVQYLKGVTYQDVTVSDDLTVSDDATITDDLTVSGDAAVTGTLAVTGASTLTGAVNYKRQVTDTGGVFATPIALTEAQSGRVILLDDAAGLDFTLPAIAAAQVGTHYKFIVTVSVTSNSYRVTAGAGDLLKGGLWCVDFDAAVTAPQAIFLEPDGSDDLIMTLNGTTSGGGKVGSWVEFIAISATEWFVHGVVAGDGTIVTPFS